MTGRTASTPTCPNGAKGEPTGLPHHSDQELTEIAETHAQQDQALRGHERLPWWKRWFGGRKT